MRRDTHHHHHHCDHLFVIRGLWWCHQRGGLRRVVKATEVMDLNERRGRGERGGY